LQRKVVAVQLLLKLVFGWTLFVGYCQADTELSVSLSSMLERKALASLVDITQQGDVNSAHIVQSGNAHYAVLLQSGVLNHIMLQQQGVGHKVILKQDGNNNSAVILQRGEANLIQIEQWGNRQLMVEQSGTGETLSIVQY